MGAEVDQERVPITSDNVQGSAAVALFREL